MNKTFRFSIVMICLLLIIAVGYYTSQLTASDRKGPIAAQGILDLTKASRALDNIVALDGQWEYYPNQMLLPADFQLNANGTSAPEYALVPHRWDKQQDFSSARSAKGYATFRLHIRLAPSDGETPTLYGIKVNNIKSSHSLYINGSKIGGSGQPGTSLAATTTFNAPYVRYFSTVGDTAEIVIQVANYEYFVGGITHSILMGSQESIQTLRERSLLRDTAISAGLLLLGIYLLALHPLRRKELPWLYLGLFGLACCLFSLTQGEKLLTLLMPSLPYPVFLRVQYLSGIFGEFFLLRYTQITVTHRLHKGFAYFTNMIFVGIVLRLIYISVTPMTLFSAIESFSIGLTSLTLLFIVGVMLVGAIKREEGAVYMMIGAMSILVLAILYRLQVLGNTHVSLLLPIPVATALYSQVLLLSSRLTETFESVEKLSGQLLAADQQKDEFLANTSHEMRTPLHGIINLSQSLLDGAAGPMNAEQRSNTSLIVATGQRLARLINDILDMSRIRHGELILRPRPLALAPIVQHVFHVHQSLAANKPIQLLQDIPGDLPLLQVDEDRLVQILSNLVGNALKFTAAGVIRISAEHRDESIYVSVFDTGIGIAAERQAAIFAPYEQLSPGEYSGIGLGLSITRKLLELHGGTITVESQLGAGSTFTFSLPVADAQLSSSLQAAENRIPAASPIESASETALWGSEWPLTADSSTASILVVDDDPTNRKVLENLLSIDRMSVTSVENGELALRQLANKEGHYDLVILDLMMPGLSGLDVCKNIRERWSLSELPVLLLTARSRPEDMLAGFEAGANDFLGKPVDARELRTRIRTLLAMKKSASETVASELALLQAQIKPHFLFNTLNTILAVSDTDLHKTQRLLTRLSYYLRSSFDFHNREQTVTLEQELELVQAYLFIEQARFGDRLQFHLECDKQAVQQHIPTMTIQPIVENAVRHGIMKHEDGGLLTIRIALEENYIHVIVEDNGIGLPAACDSFADFINQRTSSPEQRQGIGLTNIHRRLVHKYGEGLHMFSRPGIGTKVSFRIITNA
ncbi:ATP-binding protein [Paenibacillus sp. HWE-109]|uniref:hybrid sensor histidine kinase/response regulator n=1 Tax=Paenibacillus sp. HWE-109 TaxID=1306526 RepID=UPI001EDDC2A3|nr:ATP-binding protein [Paenibacillus sp. HWE-109]UKS27562.1 ATP-binding protein [Paenibacillus sp. HWE-109]